MLDELRGKAFPVLDDGHVMLVDVMGDDSAIVDAARVSYGAGTKRVSDDAHLIRYLMRHRHTTPFEMVEFKFRVRVPMDHWRQWIRHRTASVNEYSTRYSEAIDSAQMTKPTEWRSQSGANKQGSAGTIQEQLPSFEDAVAASALYGPFCIATKESANVHYGAATVGEYLSGVEKELHKKLRLAYQERLRFGVAREQARKDLPLSTYTEAYWKIDLHNLFHFLALRMDAHAQQEIREYANTIGYEIVANVVPIAWQAFLDYRLNGMQLSSAEIEVIRQIQSSSIRTIDGSLDDAGWSKESRERRECMDKLERLGIIGSACVEPSA